MSDRTLARRTRIKLEFESVDISEEVEADLLSFSYTDTDGETADDLQVKLQDTEGRWMEYLDTPKQPKTPDGDWKIGDKVKVTGIPQYTSYGEFTPGDPVANYEGTITYLNIGAPFPIHVDHLGWFKEGEVTKLEGQPDTMTSNPGGKGALLHAFIIQENWNDDGRDNILDCGTFELDTVNYNGPPATVDLKGTSIPNVNKFNVETRTKYWEKVTLSEIASEIGGNHGFKLLYLSGTNPFYERVEQVELSDSTFLKALALKSGITMKITSRQLVLYDLAEFEQKEAVRTIDKKSGDIISYSFSTSLKDIVYKDCKVQYTDPKTGKTTSYTYTPPDSDPEGPTLNIKEKVNTQGEAEALAKKELRIKKEGEFTGSLVVLGDSRMLAGVTVDLINFGLFDEKYIVTKAAHKVTGGYQTTIEIRQTLDI